MPNSGDPRSFMDDFHKWAIPLNWKNPPPTLDMVLVAGKYIYIPPTPANTPYWSTPLEDLPINDSEIITNPVIDLSPPVQNRFFYLGEKK